MTRVPLEKLFGNCAVRTACHQATPGNASANMPCFIPRLETIELFNSLTVSSYFLNRCCSPRRAQLWLSASASCAQHAMWQIFLKIWVLCTLSGRLDRDSLVQLLAYRWYIQCPTRRSYPRCLVLPATILAPILSLASLVGKPTLKKQA